MTKQKSEFIQSLFDAEGESLVKYLTSRFRNVEEAQEIAQEAWIRLFKLEDPSSLRNPKAFLFQTASNLAIDRSRRAVVESRYLEQEIRESEPTDSRSGYFLVEESVDNKRALERLNVAINELPMKCRQAFVMHRTNGLSYPEIAEALGVSTSMVEKYIITALKHFRNKLK